MSVAHQLSRELRQGIGEYLACRRGVAVLSLTAIASLAVVALYQLGVLKRLPQPPLAPFDTKKIHASDQAYGLLEVPDAVLGIGSYAATLGLAAMGSGDRARIHPWMPLALGTKAVVDTAQAARLTWSSWRQHRALSVYSLAVSAATLVTLSLVIPETVAAFREWRGQPKD